ncbi:GDSL-type esterase/lipase family protein [Pseudalkalibacillus sp. SCS-8]|uniref:GDSL-type esterase/lipase family protein n=1 Tax=Pseudalkalibacillus nanhaiensis TaxID=3115291 RepID=UPI0032DA887D
MLLLQKIIKYTSRILLIVVSIIGINMVDDLDSQTTVAEDDDAIRVVAIGDSLTYGSGDPKRVGYIGRVHKQMMNTVGNHVVLDRYGVRGFRTDQIMIHIQDIEAKQKISQANYLFVFIGTNDFIQAARRDLNSINAQEMEEKRALFKENLTQLIAQIRTDNQFAPMILIGMFDPYTNLINHDELHGILENWNSVTKGMVHEFPNTYYVSTIDLFLNKDRDRYFKDVIHPNPRGYELISQRVMQDMKRYGLIN